MRPLVDELLLVGVDRRDEPRVARVDDAERRQEQERRVAVLAVERLREAAELLAVAAREDHLPLARRRSGSHFSARSGAAEPPREHRAAVDRDPAHRARERVRLERRAKLPDARVERGRAR